MLKQIIIYSIKEFNDDIDRIQIRNVAFDFPIIK